MTGTPDSSEPLDAKQNNPFWDWFRSETAEMREEAIASIPPEAMPRDPLDLIREAARHHTDAVNARDAARDQLHEAIREAYKTGTLTHTQIGDLLGVSKQYVATIVNAHR